MHLNPIFLYSGASLVKSDEWGGLSCSRHAAYVHKAGSMWKNKKGASPGLVWNSSHWTQPHVAPRLHTLGLTENALRDLKEANPRGQVQNLPESLNPEDWDFAADSLNLMLFFYCFWVKVFCSGITFYVRYHLVSKSDNIVYLYFSTYKSIFYKCFLHSCCLKRIGVCWMCPVRLQLTWATWETSLASCDAATLQAAGQRGEMHFCLAARMNKTRKIMSKGKEEEEEP